MDAYEICCPECSQDELNGMIKFSKTKSYPESVERICNILKIGEADKQNLLSEITKYNAFLDLETNPKQGLMLVDQLHTLYTELFRRYKKTSVHDDIEKDLKTLQLTALHLLKNVFKYENDTIQDDKSIISSKARIGLTKSELKQGIATSRDKLNNWLITFSHDDIYKELESYLHRISMHPELVDTRSASSSAAKSGESTIVRGRIETSATNERPSHVEEDHDQEVGKPTPKLFSSLGPAEALTEIVRPKRGIILDGMLGSGKTTFLKRIKDEAGIDFFLIENEAAEASQAISFDAASFGGSQPTAGTITLFHHYEKKERKEEEAKTFLETQMNFKTKAPPTQGPSSGVPNQPSIPKTVQDILQITGGCVCCGEGQVGELTEAMNKTQKGTYGYKKDYIIIEITGQGIADEVLLHQSSYSRGKIFYVHCINVINPDDKNWDQIPLSELDTEDKANEFFADNPHLEVYYDQLKASKWVINIRTDKPSKIRRAVCFKKTSKRSNRIQHIKKLIKHVNNASDDNIHELNIKKAKISDLLKIVIAQEPSLDPKTFNDLPEEGDDAPTESEKLKLTAHSLTIDTLNKKQYNELINYLKKDLKKPWKDKRVPRFKGVVKVQGKKKEIRIMKVESNGSSEITQEDITPK